MLRSLMLISRPIEPVLMLLLDRFREKNRQAYGVCLCALMDTCISTIGFVFAFVRDMIVTTGHK